MVVPRTQTAVAGVTMSTDIEPVADYELFMRWLRRCPPPGDVPEGHPGLTPRVLEALAIARLNHAVDHPITDNDGPHLHHWEAILYVCRGCGAFDET